MRRQLAFAIFIAAVFSFVTGAVAVPYEELDTFVKNEAHIIVESLKLTDIIAERTIVEVTAHRVDAHGIHWLSADAKVVSRKYGLCGVALQLKFVLDSKEILIVSSKGVLAALEINRGVEKYQAKLVEYKNNVESGGHAIVVGPEQAD